MASRREPTPRDKKYVLLLIFALSVVTLIGVCYRLSTEGGVSNLSTPPTPQNPLVTQPSLSQSEFLSLTKAEYAEWMRFNGSSPQGIQDSLANYEDERATAVAMVATAEAKPTPRPLNDWTAEELVDCDTRTLQRQMREVATPNEVLSECEKAHMLAGFSAAVLLSEESPLPPTDQQNLAHHFANLEETKEEILRTRPTSTIQMRVLCNELPHWNHDVQEAVAYLQDLKVRQESILQEQTLLGIEVEAFRLARFIVVVDEDCTALP